MLKLLYYTFRYLSRIGSFGVKYRMLKFKKSPVSMKNENPKIFRHEVDPKSVKTR